MQTPPSKTSLSKGYRITYGVLLAAALATLAVGFYLRYRSARADGLERRPDAVPYLRFPAEPVFASETRWATVPVFPNVRFKFPVMLEPEPGTDRLFVVQLEGLIYAISSADPNISTKTPVLDLRKQTQGSFDSGMLGLAFHPEYGKAASPNRDYVYIFYTFAKDPVFVGAPRTDLLTWSRVSRFTLDRGAGVLRPESELVLIDQEDQSALHFGGGMFFHPEDGFLYVAFGDEGGQRDTLRNSQRIDKNLFSGVLRIDVDMKGGAVSHAIPRQPAAGKTAHYFIPNDNPFVGVPGALEEFYAIGLRNPHRMTYDRADNFAWIGDVGQSTIEEVVVLEIGKAPQNFQWAVKDGTRPGFMPMPERPLGTWTEPFWEYRRDQGRSITGGYVYRGRQHPALLGKYICSDFGSGKIWALSYHKTADGPRLKDVELLAMEEGWRNYHGGVGGISSFGIDHQQELYLLRHGMNVTLEKLVASEPRKGNVPERLSETGTFANLASRETVPNLIPYGVTVAQWSNGARVRRWISVPSGRTIRFDATGNWLFPAGTVLVEHFDWPHDPKQPEKLSPLETRFLIGKPDDSFYGVTYRWRPDGTEADLVLDDNSTAELRRADAAGRVRTLRWLFPSPTKCMECHAGGGYALGVKTRQLNSDFAYPSGVTENQLRAWRRMGLFDTEPAGALPRLAALGDEQAALEHRVRSYLDVNCAHCHGTTAIPALWNGGFQFPLETQGLVFGPLVGQYKGEDRYVISPKDPAGSELHRRVSENVPGRRMPPIGEDLVDDAFVNVVSQWIDALPRIERRLPTVESATARDDRTVVIVFSEAVCAGAGPGGAEDPTKYRISGGIAVVKAALEPDRRTVVIKTAPMQREATHTMAIADIFDRADLPNVIAAGTEVTFLTAGAKPTKGASP